MLALAISSLAFNGAARAGLATRSRVVMQAAVDEPWNSDVISKMTFTADQLRYAAARRFRQPCGALQHSPGPAVARRVPERVLLPWAFFLGAERGCAGTSGSLSVRAHAILIRAARGVARERARLALRLGRAAAAAAARSRTRSAWLTFTPPLRARIAAVRAQVRFGRREDVGGCARAEEVVDRRPGLPRGGAVLVRAARSSLLRLARRAAGSGHDASPRRRTRGVRRWGQHAAHSLCSLPRRTV